MKCEQIKNMKRVIKRGLLCRVLMQNVVDSYLHNISVDSAIDTPVRSVTR